MPEGTPQATAAPQAVESKSFDIEVIPAGINAAVFAAEQSVLGIMLGAQNMAQAVPDMPDAPLGDAQHIAEQSAVELQAIVAVAKTAQGLADLLGAKRDSNLCTRVARILKEKSLFGTGDKALWADETAMFAALNWKSGAVYMKSWGYVAQLEKQADKEDGNALVVVAIPAPASPNHKKNNATVAQRIFCYAGHSGVTNWKKAEKALSLWDQAVLLEGCERGKTLIADGKHYPLYSIGYGHPGMIDENAAMIKDWRAAIDKADAEAARLAALSVETPEQKEARLASEKLAQAQADAKKAELERAAAQAQAQAEKLAQQQQAAAEGAKDRAKVEAVLAKSVITSEEDLGLLRKAITGLIGRTGAAYKDYQDSLAELNRCVAALPAAVFASSAGFKAVCEDAKKTYGIDLYANMSSANSKAHPTPRK